MHYLEYVCIRRVTDLRRCREDRIALMDLSLDFEDTPDERPMKD